MSDTDDALKRAWDSRPITARERITRFIRGAREPVTVTQMIQAARCSRATAWNVVRILEARGEIERVVSGLGIASRYIYSPTAPSLAADHLAAQALRKGLN